MIESAEVALIVLATVFFVLALTWLYPPLLRPFLWTFAHACYRFTAHHRDRVPATGGALIVANHVSYIDWLMLWVACPRPVTFVRWARYDRNPLLRFFLSWAQTYRENVRGEQLRRNIASDPHSPAEFRVNGVVRNMDAWYAAFGVNPGAKLYLAPEERIQIW